MYNNERLDQWEYVTTVTVTETGPQTGSANAIGPAVNVAGQVAVNAIVNAAQLELKIEQLERKIEKMEANSKKKPSKFIISGDEPLIILSIIGLVYMLKSYPEVRHLPGNSYTWYYIMVWSSTGILSTILGLLRTVIGIKVIYAVKTIFFAAWVWGWVIISDDSVWAILKRQYRPVYRLILAFQICAIFFAMVVVAVKKKSEADAASSSAEAEAASSASAASSAASSVV